MHFSSTIIGQGLLALLAFQVAAAPIESTGAELQQRSPVMFDHGADASPAKSIPIHRTPVNRRPRSTVGRRDNKLLDKGKNIVGQAIQAKKDYDRASRIANKFDKILGRDEPEQI